MNSLAQGNAAGRLGWPGTMGLMLVSGLLPFAVHLVPWNGPRELGAYLLPAFWMALVAVHRGGLPTALLVALVTPALNLALTGLPAASWIGPMTFELTLFVLVCSTLWQHWPGFWLAGPAAYLLAKAGTIGLWWAVPWLGYHREPLAHLAESVTRALPGLAVLVIITVRLGNRPPERNRDEV